MREHTFALTTVLIKLWALQQVLSFDETSGPASAIIWGGSIPFIYVVKIPLSRSTFYYIPPSGKWALTQWEILTIFGSLKKSKKNLAQKYFLEKSTILGSKFV